MWNSVELDKSQLDHLVCDQVESLCRCVALEKSQQVSVYSFLKWV